MAAVEVDVATSAVVVVVCLYSDCFIVLFFKINLDTIYCRNENRSDKERRCQLHTKRIPIKDSNLHAQIATSLFTWQLVYKHAVIKSAAENFYFFSLYMTIKYIVFLFVSTTQTLYISLK